MSIKSIHIQNFKSIRDSGEIEIGPINILIGPNGVGKSNFISFFKLLNNIYKEQLQRYIAESGYADKMLYFGRKKSKFIAGGILFRNDKNQINNRYDFKLTPDQENSFYFEKETGGFNTSYESSHQNWNFIEISSVGKLESGIKNSGATRFEHLKKYFENFNVFHFHDTSASSTLKQASKTLDYRLLREDGSNLASYLFRIKDTHPNNYKMIEYAVRSVAPFFNKFDLKPDAKNPDVIFLNWLELNSDEYFNAHNLSDGTLRFIALSTLLLQPDLPKTIIIDEPELGLHPAAVIKLAAMIKSASTKTQIIVSTQSVNLLDQFEPKDVIVVEREDNQTVFKRPDTEALSDWLKDYSIGELWGKNVLGGTP